jgi:hypothetical protein
VSGRGHRAALPACGHARPEYLVDADGSLTVLHYNREGRARLYDFTQLPVPAPMQFSLAALFAARCTPDRWSMHVTSMSVWRCIRRFAVFLAGLEPVPRDLDELTASMVRQWRVSLPAGAGGHRIFQEVSGLLRDDRRLQARPVADEIARRVKTPRSRTQSYRESEFEEVTAAARRRFRAALQRINDNARHLRQWREGAFAEGSRDWVIGEGLDMLARTGDLPRFTRKDGRPWMVQARYRKAFGRTKGTLTWQRLFLTREEAAALSVLLLAEFGWNLSVVAGLEVPVASPDQGEDGHPVYRISLEKRRRGPGRHHETRNVTDHGAGSPGRLITQALEATRYARAIVGERAPDTSRLIVWRTGNATPRRMDNDARLPVGPFRFGITSDAAGEWAKAEGLPGSPFLRGRRTVVALDRREPGQQSQDTHDRHYVLPDERVRAEAAEVIAAGAEDAAGRARKAVLAAELRDKPDPGHGETATAACSSSRDSPWPAPDGGCGASFLMCLACPNARVHPGHHPRLAHLHEALASLRSVLPAAAWAADWRDAHDRLEDLKEQIGDGPWAQARGRVTDGNRDLVSHLLNGDFDR